MMPVRGLHPEELTFEKVQLPGRNGIYFSAVVLSMWDNIHGPKILSVWKGNTVTEGVNNTEPSTETLVSVANYSLNDEAGRIEKLVGVDPKFYALLKYNIIASAFIFTTEVIKGKPEVFSFILLLPYSEMAEYLARHSLCENKVQRLLEDHLISHLQLTATKGLVRETVMKVLHKFTVPLQRFTEVMLSVRCQGLPDQILIAETFLGRDFDKKPDIRTFLQHAITAHLQSSGYTVVVGEDESTVNKMIRTLGLFLSAKERKMSRLVWCPTAEDNPLSYEPELFLQGLVVAGEGPLPFCKGDLWQNKLPCTIIHMDSKEVRLIEPPMKVPVFIRRKEDPEATKAKKLSDSLALRDLTVFDGKELSSRTVQEFLENLRLLPLLGGVREAYIFQFLRMLKLRALTLTKYIDAEPKSTIQQAGEQIVGVLALRGATADRPKVNMTALHQDLSIDSAGDLYIILAFAEKIRPNIYLDVLGDPQLQAEAVIKEFETF